MNTEPSKSWAEILELLRRSPAARVRLAVLLIIATALAIVCAALVVIRLVAPVQPTMTLDEAKTRATLYAQLAADRLPGHPRLVGPARTSVECDGNVPRGSVDLADTYDVDYSGAPSSPSNTTVINTLYNYWAFSGYAMLGDETKGGGRRIRFENPKDGFRFGLIEPAVGTMLSLQISAPCVKP